MQSTENKNDKENIYIHIGERETNKRKKVAPLMGFKKVNKILVTIDLIS